MFNQDAQRTSRTIFEVGCLRALSVMLAGLFLAGLASTVPPEVFGKFNLIFSIVQVSCVFILAWPNQAFLRYGRENFKVYGVLGDALGARLTIHLILLVFLATCISFFSSDFSSLIGIEQGYFLIFFLLAVVVMPLQDLFLTMAQMCARFKAYGWSSVFQRTTQLLAVGAIFVGLSPTWQLLMAFTLLSYGVAAMIAWRSIPQSALHLSFSKEAFFQSLCYSWAMPISILSALLLNWVDLWFIRAHLGIVAVGHYSMGYAVTLLAMNLLVPVSAVFAPRVIDLELSRKHQALCLFSNKIFSICMLVAALLPCVIAFGHDIGRLLIPAQYTEALPIMLLLVAAIICQMGISFAGPIIYAQQKLVSRMALIVILMLFVKVLGNFLLIERTGIYGSVIATLACYNLGLFLQWQLVRSHLGKNAARSWPVISSALTIAVFAYFTVNFSGSSSLMGLCVTLLMLYLFRIFGHFSALPLEIDLLLGQKCGSWLRKRQ